MFRHFLVCAAIFAVFANASTATADDVDMSAAERAANIKAYARQKAEGLEEVPRGRRGAVQPTRKQQTGKRKTVQQEAQLNPRCEETVRNSQKRAAGTAVLTGILGLVPFGGVPGNAIRETDNEQSASDIEQDC